MKRPFKDITKIFSLAVYDACRGNKTKLALVVSVVVGSYFFISSAPRIAENYEKISAASRPQVKNYKDFVSLIADDQIESLKIGYEGKVEGKLRNGKTFTTILPEHYQNVLDRLVEKKVNVEIDRTSPGGFWNAVGNVLMIFSLAAVLLSPFKFTYDIIKTGRASFKRRMNPEAEEDAADKRKKITFQDVAGVDEAVKDLREIVDFLRNPEKFKKYGARIPKGALLVGPPGTGKTQLARAVAGEANVPFFVYSGSDFIRKWAGHGADYVRGIFDNAKKNSPCIIFIDELDAIGRVRSSMPDSGSAANDREGTLIQLLTGIDGFEPSQGVILIAATNRPDVLDPAITRPGRIDRRIEVPTPDLNGREAILRVHTRNVPLASDVDLMTIARGISGFSGADIENLVNEAALTAMRRHNEATSQKTAEITNRDGEDKSATDEIVPPVEMKDFERAKDRIIMGAERNMIITEEEKKLTAYHEAGHALISILMPGLDPLHKVTIIPRGQALGVTVSLPERDRYSMKKPELEAHLQMLFGGRIAEGMIFGEDNITTGARSDIERATRIARSMVTEYGFSKLGPIDFYGRHADGTRILSEETAKKVDGEVASILETNHDKAKALLEKNRAGLDRIAEGLLANETLTGDEIKKMVPEGILHRHAFPLLAPAAE